MRIQHRFLEMAALLLLASVARCSADPLDTWHVRRLPQATNVLNAVTYANGHFVAVGSSGDNGEILTSTDGVAWTRFSTGTNNYLFSAAYGAGRFVTIGDDQFVGGIAKTAAAFASTNGLDWTPVTNAPAASLIAYGNGLFVAADPGSVSTSPDGLNWSRPQAHGISTHLEDMTYVGGRFVIVGRNHMILVPSVWASTNGTDWFASGPLAGQSEGLFAVNWGRGSFVAGGGGFYLISGNGTDWSRITGPELFYTPRDICFGDGVFVSVGYSNCCFSGAGVQSSPDGLQWLARDSGWTNGLNSVAYGNGTFVAVGAGGAILQSDDTRPRLSARVDGNSGAVELSVTGGLVRSHRLQAAVELPATNWTDLLTFTNTAPATNFVDTGATNFNRRFHRVVSP